MKKFLSGILVGILIMTSTITYAETKKTIDAIFGQVKLVVDGKPVDKETLLYNGTTYIPLRAAADALSKEISYDDATKTAYIGAKPIGQQINNQTAKHIEFTSTKLDDYYGTPVLDLEYKNNTSEDIIRFDYYIRCYDAYGKVIVDQLKDAILNKLDKYVDYQYAFSDKKLLSGEKGKTRCALSGAIGVYYAEVRIFKYQTSSGKTVEISDKDMIWVKVEK